MACLEAVTLSEVPTLAEVLTEWTDSKVESVRLSNRMRKGSANKRIYKWARLSDSGRAAAPALPPSRSRWWCTLAGAPRCTWCSPSPVQYISQFGKMHFSKRNILGKCLKPRVGVCTFNYWIHAECKKCFSWICSLSWSRSAQSSASHKLYLHFPPTLSFPHSQLHSFSILDPWLGLFWFPWWILIDPA